MTLRVARLSDGSTPLGDRPGPYPTDALAVLRDRAFSLPGDDPFLDGSGDAAHAYVDQARSAWSDHPEHMDFLDPDSPVFHLKGLERDLYLDDWAPPLRAARSVLDVGCGVGRFALWALDEGKDVVGVDPDLRSLHRLAWRAPGRPGRLDLVRASVDRLPEGVVDAAIACEVLCYIPDTEAALAGVVARVRPGGVVCFSVEARWGWAAAVDASPGSIAHALVGDGIVDLPGETWVRTFDEDGVIALAEGAGLVVEACVPHHYVLDGPLERTAPEALSLDMLRDLEEAARAHPVWSPLNRIWSVVARRPA